MGGAFIFVIISYAVLIVVLNILTTFTIGLLIAKKSQSKIKELLVSINENKNLHKNKIDNER